VSKIIRKYKHSKYFIQRTVEGFTYFEAYFNDLEDEDLQMHYNNAMAAEDFEYAQEVWAEAKKRNLNLQLENY